MRPTNRLMLLLTLTFMSVGCGKNTATVTGKVTYEGKPLAWGAVVAVAENAEQFQAMIEPDGAYSLRGVPFGTLRVMVRQPPRKTREKLQRFKKSQARSPIPNRYSRLEEAGLAINVDSAIVPFDIDLR